MMISEKSIRRFKFEITTELLTNILPFWMEKTLDESHGGFYGQISNDLTVKLEAEKCCILNSRILWTFAAAHRLLKDDQYLKIAERAFYYLTDHFWDSQYTGLYFFVNYRGQVANPQKQAYNLAFGIYGLSEYYRATGKQQALNLAIHLFKILEKNFHDSNYGGYFEAFSRDWTPTEDYRLSPVDLNASKSMNTHLHLIEAYTNLLRIWENVDLRRALTELLTVTIKYIITPGTSHFKLFFDEQWNSKVSTVSFGHDIEGSWLLYEAAQQLGEKDLFNTVKEISVLMAEVVYCEGIDSKYGGIYNEKKDSSPINTDKIWWPQCEAMVGFCNAYQISGQEHFIEAAIQIWQFCKNQLIDQVNGEWFYIVSTAGKPDEAYYKIGPWKCPYHNGRACMEIMTRFP